MAFDPVRLREAAARRLYRRSVVTGQVTLPAVPGMLDEYELCRREFGLNDEQLAFIARCSIEDGGAPDDVKTAALTGIEQWLAADV